MMIKIQFFIQKQKETQKGFLQLVHVTNTSFKSFSLHSPHPAICIANEYELVVIRVLLIVNYKSLPQKVSKNFIKVLLFGVASVSGVRMPVGCASVHTIDKGHITDSQILTPVLLRQCNGLLLSNLHVTSQTTMCHVEKLCLSEDNLLIDRISVINEVEHPIVSSAKTHDDDSVVARHYKSK